MAGAGQLARGSEPAALRSFPAWELVRVYQREVPRDWHERWEMAGGRLYEGRMIAMKGDGIWDEIGSSEMFDDALDVDHPPFAFNSGKRWRAVPREEVQRLGVSGPEGESLDDILEILPRPKASASGLDADFLSKLKSDLSAEESANGVLSIKSVLEGGQE